MTCAPILTTCLIDLKMMCLRNIWGCGAFLTLFLLTPCPANSARVCPVDHEVYPDNANFCGKHGKALVNRKAPAAHQNRLTLAEITEMKKTGIGSRKLKNIVLERGVDFILSAEEADDLKAIGADEVLISAITGACARRSRKTGGLCIRTSPPEADVIINDRYAGKTPHVMDRMTPGTIRLKLTKRESFEDHEQTVEIEPNKTGIINVQLRESASPVGALGDSQPPKRPAPETRAGSSMESSFSPAGDSKGIVRIDSEPRGAKIYLDQNYIGTTPAEIMYASGKYTLFLVLDNYGCSEERSIDIYPGRNRPISMRINAMKTRKEGGME